MASAAVVAHNSKGSRLGASETERDRRRQGAHEADSASSAAQSRTHRAGISCRKTHLAFVMDMHDVPWSWDTSEALLEARLREFDEEAYRQFLRDREEA